MTKHIGNAHGSVSNNPTNSSSISKVSIRSRDLEALSDEITELAESKPHSIADKTDDSDGTVRLQSRKRGMITTMAQAIATASTGEKTTKTAVTLITTAKNAIDDVAEINCGGEKDEDSRLLR
tara:strand:+ start:585 stop:953 length:369 start_codon:yes stop_codon:yes gene_type:complete